MQCVQGKVRDKTEINLTTLFQFCSGFISVVGTAAVLHIISRFPVTSPSTGKLRGNVCKALFTLATTVAENGDKFADSRRFGRQSPNSATVAVFGDSRRIRQLVASVNRA